MLCTENSDKTLNIFLLTTIIKIKQSEESTLPVGCSRSRQNEECSKHSHVYPTSLWLRENSLQNDNKQECIPVGCVLAAR